MATNEHPIADNRDDDVGDSSTILLKVFLGKQDGIWNAIAMDYTVVGTGDTVGSAVASMLELLGDYFTLCWEKDGVRPPDALRPLPRKWRAELRLRSMVAHALRFVRHARELGDIAVVVPSARLGHC